MNKKHGPKTGHPDSTGAAHKISFARDDNFTVAQVSEKLGFSTKTVRKWIRERQLRAIRPAGSNRIIITASALDDFAERNTLKNTLVNPPSDADRSDMFETWTH